MAVVTCACRDCFEITYAAEPTLCEECEQAGCVVYDPRELARYSPPLPSFMRECQRDEAYDADDESEEWK